MFDRLTRNAKQMNGQNGCLISVKEHRVTCHRLPVGGSQ
jgi:hypothetical protein